MNYAWLDIKLTYNSLEYYTDNIYTNTTYRMSCNKHHYVSYLYVMFPFGWTQPPKCIDRVNMKYNTYHLGITV